MFQKALGYNGGMCGRFSLAFFDLEFIAELLQAEFDREEFADFSGRYNIAPSTRHLIVTADGGSRRLQPAIWGWRGPNDNLLINARSETIADKPAFAGAWRERRCLVPADGFYEWKTENGTKFPYWFHSPTKALLLMGGLFRPASASTPVREFVITTTAANPVVAPVHHRMPVFVCPENVGNWLAEPLSRLCGPAPDTLLAARPVSVWVNSARHEGEKCIEPTESTKQPQQLSLFS